MLRELCAAHPPKVRVSATHFGALGNLFREFVQLPGDQSKLSEGESAGDGSWWFAEELNPIDDAGETRVAGSSGFSAPMAGKSRDKKSRAPFNSNCALMIRS